MLVTSGNILGRHKIKTCKLPKDVDKRVFDGPLKSNNDPGFEQFWRYYTFSTDEPRVTDFHIFHRYDDEYGVYFLELHDPERTNSPLHFCVDSKEVGKIVKKFKFWEGVEGPRD